MPEDWFHLWIMLNIMKSIIILYPEPALLPLVQNWRPSRFQNILLSATHFKQDLWPQAYLDTWKSAVPLVVSS